MGVFTKVGSVMDRLSDFLSEREESEMDEGGELSLAYHRPSTGQVHALRLRLKDLAAATPSELFRSSSETWTTEEEASEAHALDEAIALATEGIQFMGEEGPSAATVVRARVTGSADFRKAVAKYCSGAESSEACRRAFSEDLLCRLAKKTAPGMLGPGDEEAVTKGLPCDLSGEVNDQKLMLMAGKQKISVRSSDASEDSDVPMEPDFQHDMESRQAEKPWEHVEQIAGSMLQALSENSWP